MVYALVRLLAPLLSFTTEEVWGYLCKPAGSPDSVHLALLPEPGELTEGLTNLERERLGSLGRSDVGSRAGLESARRCA